MEFEGNGVVILPKRGLLLSDRLHDVAVNTLAHAQVFAVDNRHRTLRVNHHRVERKIMRLDGPRDWRRLGRRQTRRFFFDR